MAINDNGRPMIAIHRDSRGWYKRYERYCSRIGVGSTLVDLLADDWVDNISGCDYVVFKGTMDSENIRILKERLYFLEKILGKTAVPNWASYWHFDSKGIQRDLFRVQELRIPKTLVIGSSRDIFAMSHFPERVVLKEPSGSSSDSVRLVRNTPLRRWRMRQWLLDAPIYRRSDSVLRRLGLKVRRPTQKIVQELIENEGYDIRIVTIGFEYVYVFRRLVREHDFRASGSGRIDQSWDDRYLPLMKMLLAYSKKMEFNTMAYDVVLDKDGVPYVLEMSGSFLGGPEMTECPNVFRWNEIRGKFERIEPIDPLELQIRILVGRPV